MQLRDYQQQAVKAVYDYWAKEGGNGLIELATGTGKSLVVAELIRRLVSEYPDVRIVIASHVQEILQQNTEELLRLWPWAPAGIYSAGLGKRDTQAQILFCGIQSVHNKDIGQVDLLMVDECHLIPRSAETMYGRFIANLRRNNPDMKVLGLTATPYRLGQGRLDEGDDRLFDKTVFTYGIADGVCDGFLCPLVSKATETGFDLTGVHKRGGEYIAGELQAAVDKTEITRRAIAEAVAYGRDRRSWLCFASGVEHAHHVADEIRRFGYSCATVTGATPTGERRRILEDYKAGKIRCICSVGVLTTGFNVPRVDMIIALRPTASPGLFIQSAGRGTRCVGANIEESIRNGKKDCLFLDFAGLIRQHGPVDCVKVRGPSGKGTAPVKECPNCHSLIHASIMKCPDCDFAFPPSGIVKITVKASALAIMSTAEPEWVRVSGRTFAAHHGPSGVTVLTKFRCGLVEHKAWLAPAGFQKAQRNADRFWFAHKGRVPFPRTAEDWLERQGELRATSEISVRPDGKYIQVVDWRPA